MRYCQRCHNSREAGLAGRNGAVNTSSLTGGGTVAGSGSCWLTVLGCLAVIATGACVTPRAEAGSAPRVVACSPVPPKAAADLALRIGVDQADVAVFAKAMCRFVIDDRVAVLSYDINDVILPPSQRSGPDKRYPLPLITVDGRDAGRLVTHVPAELPVTVELLAAAQGDGLPVLCFRASTEAVGAPPAYLSMSYFKDGFRAAALDRTCGKPKKGR